jgi:hypothetical protein
MRLARVGPMRGRRMSDSAGAVSRSRRVEGRASWLEGGADEIAFALSRAVLVRLARLVRADRASSRASSTAAIWRSNAARAAGDGGCSSALARWNRTAAPRSATAAKKTSALRSEGVGTRESCVFLTRGRHRNAPRRVIGVRARAPRRTLRDGQQLHHFFITASCPS